MATPQSTVATPVLLLAGIGLIGLFLWKGLPAIFGKDGGDGTGGDGTGGGGDGTMQAARNLDVEYGL